MLVTKRKVQTDSLTILDLEKQTDLLKKKILREVSSILSMSTFCISDINCVKVLTSRVSQETYGKENLFFFLVLIRCGDFSIEV